ncbi:MAG TPA: PQQ-dependent dehydrogenase, methanol/ethanol family [Steroidobacteraceae bacterium]|jgi:PQQ-dependent dehydrogenase (methanol/ethanol family)
MISDTGRKPVGYPIPGVVFLTALLMAGCGSKVNGPAAPAPSSGAGSAPAAANAATVDDNRLVHADSEPGNWMTTGRTYDEQHFSPLKDINDQNVNQLGIAWYHDLDTNRGQEATPLVVDGVMYTSESWSKVLALDVRTGKLLWEYDPKVNPELGRTACCDVVNRGVAVWKGRVYVGALDGRLIALDAKTGNVVWSVQTTDPTQPYANTGAPRVVKGKVIIGNGGAEKNVRGYASAYDAETGKLVWRFYVVPTDPSKPDHAASDDALAKIAQPTWTDGFWNRTGGGGTPWDALVYDPELDLLYIGGGNGGPHSRDERSPGGGDNLFLGSVIAVRPDTGQYVWHFQETPGDSWDFTSVQPIILADLAVDGKPRKVLLHAPKNGFFYMIDRETGKFISGNNYAKVNWAKGLDQNGRPIMNPDAWYSHKLFLGYPGPAGAHNWYPMSFNPQTGLVYIPAQDTPWPFFPPKPVTRGKAPPATFGDLSHLPEWTGYLVAWDPVKEKEAWRINQPGPANGGTLTTAGNLVFEGTVDGLFHAYAADTGKPLWSTDLQSDPMAGAMSYTVDGQQYIAVMVGLGGGSGLMSGEMLEKLGAKRNISRVVAFRIGANIKLPPVPAVQRPANLPPSTADAATRAKGAALFGQNCAACHGINAVAGILPDLRYTPFLTHDGWFDIVIKGTLRSQGMIPFPDMQRGDADAIRAYLIDRAHQSEQGNTKPTATRTSGAPQ